VGAINEKATVKPESMGAAKVAYQKWQALVRNWRALFANKRDQSVNSSGIPRHVEGKTGREKSWQAVRQAAKTHCHKDSEV
jgi:hypothetical protein